MNNEEQESLLSMSCEERYDYFLSAVGEEREVWILINGQDQFLKIYGEEDGIEYLPVWPSAEFASKYAFGDPDLKPKSISIPQFLKKWIPGLTKDGLEVGVLPGSDKSVWITSPSELEQDLQEELSNF